MTAAGPNTALARGGRPNQSASLLAKLEPGVCAGERRGLLWSIERQA